MNNIQRLLQRCLGCSRASYDQPWRTPDDRQEMLGCNLITQSETVSLIVAVPSSSNPPNKVPHQQAPSLQSIAPRSPILMSIYQYAPLYMTTYMLATEYHDSMLSGPIQCSRSVVTANSDICYTVTRKNVDIFVCTSLIRASLLF